MTATKVHPSTTGDRVRDGARVHREPPHLTHSTDQVEAVLRVLPSHGWTAGWTGRRDRALLALSELAGLSFGQIASLTCGDLTVADGVATIRTSGGRISLPANDDDMLCGPCSLARWVHALDLTVVYPGRVIAAVIARAVPLTPDSPHLCQSNNAVTDVTRRVALLPPIDHYGHPVRVVPAGSPAVSRPVANHRWHTIPTQLVPRRSARSDETSTRASGLERRAAELLDRSPA